LWFGHPWVYGNAVARVDGDPEPGGTVDLVDADGRFIGRGLYSPQSQIPVRVVTRDDEEIDAAFFTRRLAMAKARREAMGLPSVRTNAFRLVNSEGDDLPGLVIDVFASSAAVQITTIGMHRHREEIFAALEATTGVRAIYEVGGGAFAQAEGFTVRAGLVRGEAAGEGDLVACLEDGLTLSVEPLGGQKTGMFVDQRDNRIRVGQLARGRRVLDCYAYAGGFGLQAARGGAAMVTAVDTSPRAVSRIEAHAAANRLDVRAVEADVFRFLETATPRAWDLVVLDPPKFARARKDLEAAVKGYERLNTLGLTACAEGALLVTCSCSQNVDEAEFERIVASAAKNAGRRVKLLARAGAGPDHPAPPSFPEGHYLKVLTLHVE
jgi:23S rRNA (cytosine1962-C5)-methyltransferase